jgi:hypothetical protein
MTRVSARCVCGIAVVLFLGIYSKSAWSDSVSDVNLQVLAWEDGHGNGQQAQTISQAFHGVSTVAPISRTVTSGVSTATTTGRIDSGALTLHGLADGWAVANSSLLFQDTLTITSNTLSVGTSVDFLVTLSLQRSLSATCPPNESKVLANFNLGINDLRYDESRCFGLAVDNLTAVMSFVIGQEVLLSSQLQIYAGSGNCCEPGHAETDAVLRFFIDPMGNGFGYRTASGNDYASAAVTAPEPTTLTLLVTGLVALLYPGWRQNTFRKVRLMRAAPVRG